MNKLLNYMYICVSMCVCVCVCVCMHAIVEKNGFDICMAF